MRFALSSDQDIARLPILFISVDFLQSDTILRCFMGLARFLLTVQGWSMVL